MPNFGNIAKQSVQQAADGVARIGRQGNIENAVDMVNVGVRMAKQFCGRKVFDFGGFFVVFILNIPHDFFHDVLNGRNAGCPTVFVHHHREVHMLLLHFFQQAVEFFAFGYEKRLA